MFTQEELNIIAIALDEVLNSSDMWLPEYGKHAGKLGEVADKVVALLEAKQD